MKINIKYFKTWKLVVLVICILSLRAIAVYNGYDYIIREKISPQEAVKIRNSIEKELKTLKGKALLTRCEGLMHGYNVPSTRNPEINDKLIDWAKECAIDTILSMANSGNGDAAYLVGHMNSSYNYNRAAYWFKRAAEAGVGEGALCLSVCYLKGCGVPQNEEQGFKYAKLAADLNNPEGMLLLGDLFRDGVIRKSEWRKDTTCYRCVKDNYCGTHTYEVNKVIVPNNIDSARWYWNRVLKQDTNYHLSITTRLDPHYDTDPKSVWCSLVTLREAAQARLEQIYE